jgi:hypothetical protein
MIIYLKQQNEQFLSKALESQTAQPFIIDASHNKTIKNTFNIQVYLNDTCKDAVNLDKFVENLTFEDFSFREKFIIPPRVDEMTCKTTELAKFIVKELNKHNTNKRPIQTTDKSRCKFYYKINDAWIFSDDIDIFKK